jgi:hypothetical protein
MPIFLSVSSVIEKRSAKRAKTESGNGDDPMQASRGISGRGHMAGLLGRGWKEFILRMWWPEGRIRAVRSLLTHFPSTPPILTSEVFMSDLLALR